MPRQILIVEDGAAQGPSGQSGLARSLRAAGYKVTTARLLAEARERISERLPDVALFASDFTKPGTEDLVRLLADGRAAARVPVILLGSNDPARPLSDLADAVIRLPAPEGLILARLRSVLRLRDLEEELALRASTCRELGLAEPARGFTRQPRVLLVPNSLQDGVALADGLSFEISARIGLLQRPGLTSRLERRGRPDVIVIEANPDDPAADLHYIADLRCRSETRRAALLMVFPAGAEDTAAMALDLGAADVLVGSAGPALLAATMRRHLARAERLEALRMQVADGLKLAVLDPLTGIYNRRYALSHLARLAARASESQRSLALMVLDIDRFKRVNDTFGHQNGDHVIAAVARGLADGLRAADLVARFGGEEFLIVMPDTGLDEARAAAERLCALIEATQISLDGGAQISVTLSIGLTVACPGPGPEEDVVAGMIADADRALFAAKAGGRNQMTVARTAA